MEKIVQRRYWWFIISAVVIAAGVVLLAVGGLRQGIDFAGGALWNIRFTERQLAQLNTEEIARVFAQQGFDGALVQLSQSPEGQATAIVRTKTLSEQNPDAQAQQVIAALSAAFGTVEQDSIQTVGATVSAQSRLYAIFAVVGASVAILIYLTISFRKAPHPIRYGACTIVAMLHDVLICVAAAAILGQLIGLEVDALFLTALLTVISFSVQDKIVVFDRIRENLLERRPGQRFEDIVNVSVAQVMPRSICTQLTSFFTLAALLLFGGESIRNFVLILMIGLISGTYSSMFIAAQLLVVWENQEWRRWFGRGAEEPAAA
ncbi:MAG TPA: protein translocase subunit SecF [Roseiflexaceae bacterium]|nr:protein translocase subunit SecF [Roseiflexaceae bacterium]